MLRFWKAMAALHNCCCFGRKDGLVPDALGSVGKVKPSLASLEPGPLLGLGWGWGWRNGTLDFEEE